MTRQLVGAVFFAVAAVLYSARHFAAMTFVAAKTGDMGEQYRLALQTGGTELQAMSVTAAIVGLA